MVPIYIELSKNRTASIFRYILLDEIDRKFSFMNTEVVQEEIARGFVPLVIDGFDELISRAMKVLQETNEDIIPQFEDAETMLDTIADLLKHKSEPVNGSDLLFYALLHQYDPNQLFLASDGFGLLLYFETDIPAPRPLRRPGRPRKTL